MFLVDMDEHLFSMPHLARHEMLEVLVEETGHELRKFLNKETCLKMGHSIVHRLEKILPLPTDKEVGMGCGGKKKKPRGK